MDLESITRLLLIYIHLLLCVFALHEVLVNDWKVLRHALRPEDLAAMHRRVTWLLSGLWLSGLSVAAIDIGLDLGQLGGKPKLVAKLVTVVVLSLNGVLLARWCFPRIRRVEAIGAFEAALVMAAGATSTASWLTAAFLGVAKPLTDAPVAALLLLYGVVLILAVGVAVALGAHWRRRPALASGDVRP